MDIYRIYLLNDEGKLRVPALEILAKDDRTALTLAVASARGQAFQIWTNRRLVVQYPSFPAASAHEAELA